jgi:hypothetical protein
MRAFLVFLTMALAAPALAQKVVVLEIDGDSSGKLRSQVEAALERAGVVQLMSLSAYKEVAAKKKMKGAAAMTPAGVMRVGKSTGLHAAVGGEVSDGKYKVLIYDRFGGELWAKSLALKKGRLSDDFANRLAKAVAVAAEQGVARAQEKQQEATSVSAADDGSTPDPAPPPLPTDSSPTGAVSSPGTTMPEVDLTTPVKPTKVEDEDLEDPSFKKKKVAQRPPFFRAYVGPMFTWRSQCLRPGVTACSEYEVAPEPKPQGVTVDYGSGAPYPGFVATVELFPLAFVNSRVAQGFGVLGGLQYGSSRTLVREASPQGSGPTREVISTDFSWSAQLAWRFHFQMGYAAPKEQQPFGWVGLRGGITSRVFEIDPTAQVPLPSSQRYVHPLLGLDVSVPISKFFRIEAGGSFFVSPKTSAEQIVGYGNLEDPTGGVVSTGFGLEGGVAGEIWGPLGWQARVRFARYVDRYSGRGQKWTTCTDTQCWGVGEESFTSLQVSLVAQF